MQVYHYHPITKEYMGTTQAKESPKEQGVYRIPANATETEPPVKETGHTICYNDGSWEQVPDHRGKNVWLKENPHYGKIEVTEIGEIGSEYTFEDPSDIPFPKWDESTGSWITDEEKEKEDLIKMYKDELKELDLSLPRSIEDLIDSEVVSVDNLSQYNKDRLDRKIEIRGKLQELLDQNQF